MSYSESDGQVVLKMSREDYDEMDSALKLVAIFEEQLGCVLPKANALRDRLNSGNPNYTPQTSEIKNGE